eukprot:1524135-Pleurochrysis_carterae.AAC.1
MQSPDLCSATRSTAQASGFAAVPSTRALCATTERDARGQAPRDLHTRMHQIVHRSISMLLAEGARHPDEYFCNRFSKTAFWQYMAIDGILFGDAAGSRISAVLLNYFATAKSTSSSRTCTR